MKKKNIIIIASIVIIGLISLIFLITGRARTDVYLKNYEISSDGKTMTLIVDVTNSSGYVRKMKRTSGGTNYYYTFYSTYGINSKIGARDTFEMLYNLNLNMESKPFAIGLRVQHPQELINKNQYGEKYYSKMPPASYKLTYQSSNGRGVYSFCMCPGGYVVNASSEKGRLAINGMSYHNRGSENANSAIVVTVNPSNYGTNPLDGIAFQRNLEETTYKLGNGKIPI